MNRNQPFLQFPPCEPGNVLSLAKINNSQESSLGVTSEGSFKEKDLPGQSVIGKFFAGMAENLPERKNKTFQSGKSFFVGNAQGTCVKENSFSSVEMV